MIQLNPAFGSLSSVCNGEIGAGLKAAPWPIRHGGPFRGWRPAGRPRYIRHRLRGV